MLHSSCDVPKQVLRSTISSLFDCREEFLSNPDSDFTRVQKISFEQTMVFPMVGGSENTNTELLDFFGEEGIPFASALIYRRNQVKPEAFQALFHQFTKKIPVPNTFHGFQLAGFDGTRTNLPYHPSDQDTFIQSIKGRKGINQMHLNCLYDLMNDIFLDVEIQGIHQMNEQAAFCAVLDRNSQDDSKRKRIYILDRGFASYNIFAHAIHNGQFFLIRTSDKFAKSLCRDHKEWLDSSSFDKKLSVLIGRRRTKENTKNKDFHYIARRRNYDYIEPGSDKTESLPLRILKFPIGEDSYEYTVTNLPEYAFSESAIKQLYGLRWNEEVAFRFLKYAGNLVHFHSLKKAHLIQEIYGKLTFYNFSSFLAMVIGRIQKKTDKYVYALNHTQAQKVCIRFLRGAVKDPAKLICKYLVPIRPGRKFHRNLRTQSADTLNYR